MIGGIRGFPENVKKIEGKFFEVDGSSKGAKEGVWGSPTEKIEILGSEKCILVDSGDGFAMDNRESKKPLRSDRAPDPPPVSATE